MLKPILNTGNLPAAVASTAVIYTSKSDLKLPSPADGSRWVEIGYKVSKEKQAEAKDKDITVPANFAVQIPVLSLFGNTVGNDDKVLKFLAALAADYQDKALHDLADKEITVDVTDLDRLISLYNDGAASGKKQIMEWFDNDWTLAYLCRVEERNTLQGQVMTTEKQAQKVVSAYKAYCAELAKKECFLDKQYVKGFLSSTEKLVELKHLEKTMICEQIMERCRELLAVEIDDDVV